MRFDSVFHRLAQTAFSLCLVPLFQELCQGREKFLLQIVHAAAVKTVCFGILADGQSGYKPLLEIVLVLSRYRCQGIVQKLQVLLPLDEIASGDAGEMQRSLRISMGSHSHSKL